MPPPIQFPKPKSHVRSGLTDQAGATEPRDQFVYRDEFVSRCPLQSWYPPYDLGSCEFAPAATATQALDPDPSAHG